MTKKLIVLAFVLNSRVWLEKLKQKIEEARNKGEPVRITIE